MPITAISRIYFNTKVKWASLVAQVVKNLLAMWETWVQSLGWEDLLEEGMATHSSILAWRIPWTEEPDGLKPPHLFPQKKKIQFVSTSLKFCSQKKQRES